MNCIYYQCSNLDCRLRFPSNDLGEDQLRCPKCKSTVIIVSTATVLEEMPNNQSKKANFHIEALLDNIRSAWNVGSIFRTSDGYGVRHLYLSGITPTPENKRVAKTSLGAEKSIEWTYIPNGIEQIFELKSKRYFVVLLEEHPNHNGNLYTTKLQIEYPLVLVVGNEVCGTDPEIRELSDFILSIPMMGSKKSLNVAVAFGIALSAFKFNVLKE